MTKRPRPTKASCVTMGIVLTAVLLGLGTSSAEARPGVTSVALHRAASPGKGPVLVMRTKGVRSHTGAVLAFQTSRSFADGIETRHRRWIVSLKSHGGPRLLSRLQDDLKAGGRARLKAGVAAGGEGGRLSAFTILRYGEIAHSHQLPNK